MLNLLIARVVPRRWMKSGLEGSSSANPGMAATFGVFLHAHAERSRCGLVHRLAGFFQRRQKSLNDGASRRLDSGLFGNPRRFCWHPVGGQVQGIQFRPKSGPCDSQNA